MLRKQKPKFHHKIVGINGDCVLPGLGIDLQERAMLQKNVNIVFHVAATVRYCNIHIFVLHSDMNFLVLLMYIYVLFELYNQHFPFF